MKVYMFLYIMHHAYPIVNHVEMATHHTERIGFEYSVLTNPGTRIIITLPHPAFLVQIIQIL